MLRKIYIAVKDGCEVFNVGRATQWAFADGLGVILIRNYGVA